MKHWKIQSQNVVADIQDKGAMTIAKFLIDGKWIDPFYQAPWLDEKVDDDVLQNLRGDFFCLPFGISPGSLDEFPDEWKQFKIVDPSEKEYLHGYSTAGYYSKVSQTKNDDNIDDTITLEINYIDSKVKKVTRIIKCGENSLDFVDVVEMNEDAEMAIGIHPNFRLPSTQMMKLVPPACEKIASYPKQAEPSSKTQPDIFFDKLDDAPTIDNKTIDLTLLPFVENAEELVMLCDVSDGHFELENKEESYKVVLEWDTEYYKNCLLWMSSRGRTGEPWRSRNLCLGVEPVTAPFDFGADIAASDNPLKNKGIACAYPFKKGQVYEIKHSIRVEKL